MSDERVSYGSSSGRATGAIALLVAVVVAGIALFGGGGPSFEVACLALFLGTLVWAAMLRPALSVVGPDLVLRNMLETVTVPLAAIESVTVRQVLVIRAGEAKITSSAIGRSRRQIYRDARPGGGGGGVFGSMFAVGDIGSDLGGGAAPKESSRSSHGLMVEEQLRARIVNARHTAGVADRSPEQAALAAGIERRPAVVEIALLAASALAFVVLLAV